MKQGMRIDRGSAPFGMALEARARTQLAVTPYPAAPEISPTFQSQVAAMAQRLGVDPAHLLAVMWFESRLTPNAKNPASSAVGLIQFLPSVAADLLGLRGAGREKRAVATIEKMPAEDQLGLVEAYLGRVMRGRRITSLRDLYMCVLFPTAVGRGSGFAIARSDASTPLGRAVYAQNAALDANKDGIVTAGEAAAAVEGASRMPALKKIVADVTAPALPPGALRA